MYCRLENKGKVIDCSGWDDKVYRVPGVSRMNELRRMNSL